MEQQPGGKRAQAPRQRVALFTEAEETDGTPKLEEALTSFDKAAAKGGPAATTARYYKGLTLAQLGRHDERSRRSRRPARGAASAEIADGAAVALAGARLATGDSEGALSTLRSVAAGEGAYAAYASSRVAEILESQGKTDEAMTIYQEMIDRFPQSPLTAVAREKLEP